MFLSHTHTHTHASTRNLLTSPIVLKNLSLSFFQSSFSTTELLLGLFVVPVATTRPWANNRRCCCCCNVLSTLEREAEAIRRRVLLDAIDLIIIIVVMLCYVMLVLLCYVSCFMLCSKTERTKFLCLFNEVLNPSSRC